MDVQRAVSSLSLPGDFYFEQHDTTRGLTLDASALVYQHTDEPKTHGVEDLQIHFSRLQSEIKKVPSNMLGFVGPMFLEGDEAPALPEDDLFQLEMTTITTYGMSAAQVANSVIHFLDKSVASCITKVNHKKFTIKAEVVFDHFFCEVKARVYRLALGQHCVEIQRRDGDVLAFNRLYQCLEQHVSSCMAGKGAKVTSEPTEEAVIEWIFPEIPSWDDASSKTSLEPLLEIIEFSRDQRLQAEAVLALAQAAQKTEVAANLCTQQVVCLFLELCLTGAGCFSITEPLSRLAHCLATLPQAKALPEIQQLNESLKGNSLA